MRNPDCPNYRFCLGEAARTNEEFTCHRCPDQSRHEPEPIDERELEACLALVALVVGMAPDTLRYALHGPRPWAATAHNTLKRNLGGL